MIKDCNHRQIGTIKGNSNYVSIIQRYLSKNRKYYINDRINEAKQNVLKKDVENMAIKIVNQNYQANFSCQSKLKKEMALFNRNKFLSGHRKVPLQNQLYFFSKEDMLNFELKKLKKQLTSYICKLRPSQHIKANYYQQYLKLAQQSFDYIEYYLRHHLSADEIEQEQILKSNQRKIIISMIKNQYKCFTQNPFEISNRIFLSFNLNPLNDFHFVKWETFSKLRKIMSGDYNRSQCKEFLVNYFFVHNKSLSKLQFWSIFASIICKLEKLISKNNVQTLLARIESYGSHFVKGEQLSRPMMMTLINSEPMFIWDELIQLIFLV